MNGKPCRRRSYGKGYFIHKALDGYAECEITFKKIPYTVRLTQKEKDQIHTSCSCNAETHFPLCLHKTAVLLKLREVYGPNAFEMMKDWTAEKAQLLAEYGFSLDDDLKGKFDLSSIPIPGRWN